MTKTAFSNPYWWLNEDSRTFLSREYLLPGTSPEQRVDFIAEHAEKLLVMQGFAKKFKHYMEKGFYSLSTPIWTNFGLSRGLPVSCYGSVAGDSVASIASSVSENMMMSKVGGGTSLYMGLVRGRGSEITNNGKSSGSFSFLKMFDSAIDTVSQGQSRRGMCAAYIDIDHPDFKEWLNIRKENNPIQNLYYGVCISDDWFLEMKAGDAEKRELWGKVLESKEKTGTPYIFFTDNVNNNKPEVYKDMKIHASNLCTEIMLPSSEDESFICCLASMNVALYDEWKDTDAAEILTYFLDAVLTEFIEKASVIPYMDKTVRFAKNHRAIGIGVLGWHSYLQSKMIPFTSLEATYLTNEIFSLLQKRTLQASEYLRELYGPPEGFPSLNRRNTTLMSIAPTKSSSFILGQVSPGIEPIKSNYQIMDLAKIKSLYKNPLLVELLESKGKNTSEVWKSIADYDGSVQHLEFLTVEEKLVFLTFFEIDQQALIRQAAQRQKYIDQGQSINVVFKKDATPKEINAVYMLAHKLGIKSMYYQDSVNVAQSLSRDIRNCASCES